MELSRKLRWVAILYFAEGFPFGIAYKLWPVYFRVHGVSLAEIGLMSLLFLPYTLKAAWAPLVDRFGARQHWIAGGELALAAAAAVLLALDPGSPTSLLWFVLLAFTVASATQDIAIDAYAVDLAEKGEQGPINGVRIAAYRAAMIAAGGLALVLADIVGWGSIWVGAIVVLMVMAGVALASPRIPRARARSEAVGAGGRWARAALVAVAVCLIAFAAARGWPGGWTTVAALTAALALASFFDPAMLRWALQPRMLLPVAFVLLYKVGDSTLGRMVEPFWVDRGLTPTEIGLVSTTLGTALTVAGALAGGWWVRGRGIFSGLLWFGIAQALSNFGYVAVAALELPRQSIYVASAIESLTQGLGTAAFLSFLMALCDKEHAATQFALLSGVFALSRDLFGAVSGFGAEAFGYAGYFTLTALLALPGLALLPLLARGRDRDWADGRPEPAR